VLIRTCLLLVVVVAPLPAAAGEACFRPLFNGRDLSGWEGVTADASTSWKVEDGMIVCTGRPGTWLRSKHRYGDFNLRFEYRLLPGGNSGIYLRVPADGAHREGGGAEVQILDDGADRYKNIEPGQFCGSVYKVAPATRHVSRPAGQWNTMEINCCGSRYRVTHNGVVVVDATAAQFPELGRRFQKGYLGLQNHREEVWFKNLRIGPPQP
jgi:3-keto-disaccharide hydrolase